MHCKDKASGCLGGYTGRDFAKLKALGMNLVRLGIFWDGIEPEKLSGKRIRMHF